MRLEYVRERMHEEGIGHLAITQEAQVEYIFGVPASGLYLISSSEVQALTSNFHRYEVEETGIDANFYSSREEAMELAESMLKGLESVSADADSGLLESVEVEESSLVEDMRREKTKEEVERIREACRKTSKNIEKISGEVFSGSTEYGLVNSLNRFYSERGVPEAFLDDGGMSLVQGSCLRPHRGPRDRKLDSGEMVIVDSGCVVGGYRSDITRTFCANPSEEQRRLFEDVVEIQSRMEDEAEAGLKTSRLYEMLLEQAEKRGYNPQRHILYPPGHGVGVRVHEPPSLSPDSDQELREGDVITLEPGLHVPGVGGCRIEDVYLVEADGLERLSGLNRRLVPE